MKLIKTNKRQRRSDFLGVRISPELKKDFKALCDANGVSLSEALDQIIRNYINYTDEIQKRLKAK